MRRREFLIRSASGLGAAWLSSRSILKVIAEQTLPAKFAASDTISLGSTGIKTSRLAMGTGTVGSGHHSHQTALGVKGLSDLLLNGYDHGLAFSTLRIPTEAIPTSRKHSSMCRGIR